MNTITLNYIMTLSDNQKIRELLIQVIGNILIKQDNIYYFIKENEDKIFHIRDWITSVIENNEEWKKPRVLTLNSLNNTADKYFYKKNNKLQTIKLNETHEKLIADLGEYYIVQMLTPEALDNESKQMQHCIGHGGYDKKLNNANYKYLSFRDKYNKSHATIEIYKNNIEQLQGKQNQIPEFKYLNILLKWLISEEYKISLKKYNLIINKNDNKLYYINNLPENCRVDGDLYLTNNIPRGLIVDKCLTFHNIREISEDVICGSLDLELNDFEIKKIPKNLKTDIIYMYGIKFKWNSIPESLFIDNYVNTMDILSYLISEEKMEINLDRYNLIFNKIDNKIYSIYEMPENLETINGLNLLSKNIKKLPDNLIVNGDLILKDCYSLTKLSKKLTVNGNFELSYCHNINYISEDLIVKNKLILNELNIKELPKNIKLGESLFLNKVEIEKLPDNLSINGDFSIYHCNNLTKLPKNLFVSENLNLYYSKIKEIPEDIKIGKNLFLIESEIEKLPDNLNTINCQMD